MAVLRPRPSERSVADSYGEVLNISANAALSDVTATMSLQVSSSQRLKLHSDASPNYAFRINKVTMVKECWMWWRFAHIASPVCTYVPQYQPAQLSTRLLPRL